MALETIYKTVNDNGEYSCGDIGISKEEWFELLKDPEAKPYHDTLFCFLRIPDHAASCSTISNRFGNTAAHYNAKITNFAKWVQKKLNRFKVIGTDGKNTYWCIPMKRGWYVKQDFKWQLRDELVEALQFYLLKALELNFRSREPFNGFEEAYKWALLDESEGKNVLEIIKKLPGQIMGVTINLIDNARVNGVLNYLLENKPTDLTKVGEHLIDETKPIDDRIAAFKAEMRSICPSSWKSCANDERTASVILTCKYPERYTFYKDEVYQAICQYFGFESRKPGKKFSHFIEIINRFTAELGEKIQQDMLAQITQFKNKPLNLAVQTLFWCMREYMKNRIPKKAKCYWLAGCSYGGTDSQFDRFINDGIWEGGFADGTTYGSKFLEDANSISEGDIIILKSTAVKGPNRDQPFLRVKAVGVVTNDISVHYEGNETRFECKVNYISTKEKDFDGASYGAYRRTLHRADEKVQAIIDYVNDLLNQEPMPELKYKEYIELLQETYNLVLTGAPGTGKTHMAQAIADEMGAVTMFVQFHPSYDYTDFVEGLRPIEKGDGQMGFERKDGVFKEFCARAITDKSTQAGNIMADSLAPKGISRAEFWSIYNSIVADIQSGRLTSYPTPYKSQSLSVKNGRIVFRADSNNPRTEKESNLKLLYDYFVSLNKYDLSGLDKDDYWNLITTLTNGATKTIDYIEYNWILQEMLNRAKQISVKKDQVIVTHPDILDPAVLQSKHNNKKRLRPFVFIIDEINRGEASKIFGELFFAIDPGYRGKTDILVQTQYQNLVPETDVFAKGFYVPENVYILATMNDIDRSVESMDFAMRRRFTWHEITPNDTESMLDTLPCADEAKERMHRLNNAIAETDGLGAAYMIGPAYFLKLDKNGGDFEKLWKMNIQPLLKEYLRGYRKTEEILEKFSNAYFGKTKETATGSSLLEDEN